MTTITKEFTKEQLIEQAKKNIEVLRVAVERVPGAYDAAVIHLKLAEITLASLKAEPVAKIIAHYPLGIDVGKQKFVQAIGELPDFGGHLFAAPPVPVVPAALPENDDEDGHDIDYLEPSEVYSLGRTAGWNACRAAMLHGAEPVSQTYKFPVNTPCQDAPAHIWLQTAGVWPENGELSELTWCSHNQHHDDTLYVRADLVNGNYPVTPARLPGGFTIEDAKALHEDLVRSHISQALSGEKMKKNDRDADLRWIHGVIVQAAWFVKASLEQNALSGNSPLIPGEVLSAILKFARVRADFDDFDGDRRGIGDCLDEAEQELIVTINKYASQLVAEPIATNDVREQQTAVPPVPEIQADVEQAIEKLKRKLVECNRYNYCADAVKGVEDACRAVSYSHADNQPASGNQAAESNRGNEWTGNPDIDNAIIMLDRIDTAESCDDDRIEAVKAVLRRLAGNYPVTPDGWISCSERMPEKSQNVLISVNIDSEAGPLIYSARYIGDTFRRGGIAVSPGNDLGQATHWMPLPEPPQEAK
ncbi:TPA: hypothetical protein GE500_21815 [Escherichia coli]|nr:hypothetical protein [Escherichia coli]